MQTWQRNRRPLFIVGEFTIPSSYCFVARMIVTALARAKMHIAIDSRCALGGLGPQCPRWMWNHVGVAARDDWSMWIFPPSSLQLVEEQAKQRIGKKTIIHTTWEVAFLHPSCVDMLNKAAMVIVPSKWNQLCFRACGVTVPIYVVPLGCDTGTFRPGILANDGQLAAPPGNRSEGPACKAGSLDQDAFCTFGTAGALHGGGFRKNLEFVADAFQHAFPTEEDVRLEIKVSPTCIRHWAKNADGSMVLKESLLKLSDDHLVDHRIEVIASYLSDPDLADWYRGLDAMINASSGEGFGLHLLEAMACGTPLISPAFSGETEYFCEAAGYVAKFGLSPVPKSDLYQGVWIKPGLESFAACMRAVYDDRAEARRRGQAAAKVAAAFSWDAMGERLKHQLGKRVAA